jgi:hypothetical protein
MKAYKTLTWILYGLLVWIGWEMVWEPQARYRLGAAGLAALAAIFVVTLKHEPEVDDEQ